MIFVHCTAGEDRTGEISGAYYMQYLNMSFHQALEIDNTNENRDIRCMSANELMWYCYYLQVALKMPNIDGCVPLNSTYCTGEVP